MNESNRIDTLVRSFILFVNQKCAAVGENHSSESILLFSKCIKNSVNLFFTLFRKVYKRRTEICQGEKGIYK